MLPWMKILFTIVFLLPCYTTFSQSEINGHPGSVVLSNDQVLAGELVVYLDFNTLAVKTTDQLIVLPSHKVNFFRYYDEEENINRQFISFKDSGRGNHLFYEVVLQGDYKIVRKLDHAHARHPDHRADYTYFLFHHDGLIPVRAFSKEIFPDLIDVHPDLYEWVKKERLDLNSLKNIVIVLHEYNRLNYPEQLVAVR